MSKKLDANGLFESSRMMLPEHRERIVEHRRELDRAHKPVLDEQKVEQLSILISDALRNGLEVRITLFDPFELNIATGRIQSFDPLSSRLKLLQGDDELVWISMKEVLDIEWA